MEELVNKKVKEINALNKKNEKRVLAENQGKSKKEKGKSEKIKQPQPSAISLQPLALQPLDFEAFSRR